MARTTTNKTVWRATGPYLPTLASKSSLVDETRLFLATYARVGDVNVASRELIDAALPQRSRRTRTTIVSVLRMRLTRWNPPSWVLNDLVSFAQDSNPNALRLALLLHIARQDHLLYNFIQQIIVPRWHQHLYKVHRSDVQGFLDASQEDHPEITHWSYTTRERLSNSVLTVLRDCRLLEGQANKRIVAPTVPLHVAHHLVRLLIAEGVSERDLAQHPDWRLWLWESTQAQQVVAQMDKIMQEK